MLIEAFGEIVKFNQKGAMTTITGYITKLDSCDVLKESCNQNHLALNEIIQAHKDFAKRKAEMYEQEILELENKLSSIN